MIHKTLTVLMSTYNGHRMFLGYLGHLYLIRLAPNTSYLLRIIKTGDLPENLNSLRWMRLDLHKKAMEHRG